MKKERWIIMTEELQQKIDKSIQRLKSFEPPEGYFVAFSGGKDSIVVKQLCIEAGVKFDAHYSVTSVDPPTHLLYKRTSSRRIYGYST